MADFGGLRDEAGFSLPELLVVILIVGLLAALGIPQFLSQKQKADDGSAKSAARNLAAAVETCAVDEGKDYTSCDTAAELPRTGLDYGSGLGQVEVSSAAKDSFEVTAKSGAGHTFTWSRNSTGVVTLSCSPAAGGCHGGVW